MPDRLPNELKAFYELARVAAGPDRVAEILEGICAGIRVGFGFERALLVRYDERRRTVHAVVQQGIDWPGEQWLLIEKFPFLIRAMVQRRAVFVEDARSEPAMPGKIAERFGVRSVTAVPLMIEDQCLGFIVADRMGGEFVLSEEDLHLLSTLGWVAAVFVDRADQQAELEETLEELRQLDRIKSDFISIASHELRTPIAVVYGIASTLHLRGDELRQGQLQELRQTMFEQSGRLAALAEGLLDLSRLEAGGIKFRPQRLRPRERIDELLVRVAPDRLDDVEVRVADNLELEVDPEGFERVAQNLLTNALRYGEPPVEVDAEASGRFRLIVRDHGPGVEPEFVPLLFERFSRSARSQESTTAGAGLGLAIARSFARELGGELVYEPARPGARFTFTLPGDLIAGNGLDLEPAGAGAR